jgi:conjugal transfer/entry exclusion protein
MKKTIVIICGLIAPLILGVGMISQALEIKNLNADVSKWERLAKRIDGQNTELVNINSTLHRQLKQALDIAEDCQKKLQEANGDWRSALLELKRVSEQRDFIRQLYEAQKPLQGFTNVLQ